MAVWNVIDHTEFSGSAVSYDKTSIPASYDHLYFVASARTDVSTYLGSSKLTFNGVGGTSYGVTPVYATTGTPTTDRETGHDCINWIYVTAGSHLADTFGTVKIWIPNYANTSNYKQVLSTWSAPNNSLTNSEWIIGQTAGLFMNTAAINQLTFGENTGNNFVQYSTFTLYGINGAA
tara:strand:- start:4 stop:534 length:531 start_codon:yes stop_codon:yes gene_type:complete